MEGSTPEAPPHAHACIRCLLGTQATAAGAAAVGRQGMLGGRAAAGWRPSLALPLRPLNRKPLARSPASSMACLDRVETLPVRGEVVHGCSKDWQGNGNEVVLASQPGGHVEWALGSMQGVGVWRVAVDVGSTPSNRPLHCSLVRKLGKAAGVDSRPGLFSMWGGRCTGMWWSTPRHQRARLISHSLIASPT